MRGLMGRAQFRHARLLWLVAVVTACGAPGSNATAQTGFEATAPTAADARLDMERALADLEFLAADSLEGRQSGTRGNAIARGYLIDAFRETGLEPMAGDFTFDFPLRDGGSGVNVAGVRRGLVHPDRYIVISAHYDHLGVRGGEIYNGADDNASGTAGLLALARYFQQQPPENSILFVAFDAEEGGLQGARAFVADPPVPLDQIVINVNLDMVSRNTDGELYVAGTYHYPFLEPLVARVAESAPVTLIAGHDRPGLPAGDDWTRASDHGAFHDAGVPFLYFGVEDHADYHRPTDTFENIEPDFYGHALETILDAIATLDRELDAIAEAATAAKATR